MISLAERKSSAFSANSFLNKPNTVFLKSDGKKPSHEKPKWYDACRSLLDVPFIRGVDLVVLMDMLFYLSQGIK